MNDSEVKCRKVVIRSPEGHEVEGTAVSFHEDNDEYVEMHVNEDDFECMEEDDFIDQMVEDELDREVSFNNNATARSMTVTTPPPEELMKKGGGSKGETEEEKEMRIVNKTVVKLKEFMTAGNYLKQDVTRQVIIPKTSTGKSPKRSSTIKQGGVLNPCESVSESTTYQNAVQPAERPREDIKLLVHEEKDNGSIFTTQAVKDALELLRVSNYSSSNVNPSNLMRESGSSDDEPVTSSGESNLQEQINMYLNNAREQVDISIVDTNAPVHVRNSETDERRNLHGLRFMSQSHRYHGSR